LLLSLNWFTITKDKKVAKSLLGLSLTPARTLNDFFAGFFYGQIKINIEVNPVVAKRSGWINLIPV
jgi:hypothetical protein